VKVELNIRLEFLEAM